MLKIGNLEFPFPCILAPLAGVSDLPYRTISREFGCPFAFTEMIDARALAQKSGRTQRMTMTSEEDSPLGLQLVARNSDDVLWAFEELEKIRFDLLDFNAACPTPKIVRKGAGAALMRDPAKLEEILRTLVAHAKVPVTVKIRAGWDSDSMNGREVALRAQDAGIQALFIHGRTKTQGYRGEVDYTVIKEVKEAVVIPVIASGDNLSPELIGKMFEETGCDGVTIARGALGNPWIFPATRRFLETGETGPAPSIPEKMKIMRRHLDLSIEFYGEKRGVACFHKFFIWYTRGLHRMRDLRDTAFRSRDLGAMLDVIGLIEEQGMKLNERPGGRGSA